MRKRSLWVGPRLAKSVFLSAMRYMIAPAPIIAATGASQFEFLDALTGTPEIDWSRVEMFHLDEYIGLPISHPASFRKYLFDRFINKTGITKYHLLEGDEDVPEIVGRIGSIEGSAD